MPRKTPLLPLPAQATDVVYYCPECQGKATFGAAYFAEVGEPDACPNCGSAWDEAMQSERIHRMPDDTADTMAARKAELMKRRADALPRQQRPDNPRDARRAEIARLREQLATLEAAEATNEPPATADTPAIVVNIHGRPPGIRLGP